MKLRRTLPLLTILWFSGLGITPAAPPTIENSAVFADVDAGSTEIYGSNFKNGDPPAFAKVGAPEASRTGEIPLYFEPNQGQTDVAVKYLARGENYTLFITDNAAVLHLIQAAKMERLEDTMLSPDRVAMASVRIGLVGARPQSKPAAANPLAGHSNYLKGSDPSHWVTGVKHYAKIRRADVYQGIDLVYYGNGGRIQYDFVLQPGARPDAIRLRFEGIESLSMNDAGQLLLTTGVGTLVQHAPLIYQERNGRREVLAGGFQITAENELGFKVPGWDRERVLVIDPVLEFATYLGGSDSETGADVALDSVGNIVTVGSTFSVDFPTTLGVFQAAKAGPPGDPDPLVDDWEARDIFVTKFDPTGSLLLFSTFVGGSNADFANVVAVDSSDNIVVGGFTESLDFPLAAAAQPIFAGGDLSNKPSDAVLFKLEPNGSSLVFSTYQGGFDSHFFADLRGVAIDGADNIYVIGDTGAPDFPSTANFNARACLDGVPGGPGSIDQVRADATFSIYSPAGAVLLATCIGGDDAGGTTRAQTRGRAITLEGTTVYLAGQTHSGSFPTTAGAFQTAIVGERDVWLSKLSPGYLSFDFATLLGGSSAEFTEEMSLDAAGNLTGIGLTNSVDFPVTPVLPDFPDVFVGGPDPFDNDLFFYKLNSTGSALIFSHLMSGSRDDIGWGLQLGVGDEIYLGGYSHSDDFPTTADAIDVVNVSDPACDRPSTPVVETCSDAIFARVNPTGTTLEFSTYLGGSLSEFLNWGLAVDAVGAAYLFGSTQSVDFPVTAGAFQVVNTGAGDTFLAKIAPDAIDVDLQLSKVADAGSVSVGDTITYTLTGVNLGPATATGVVISDKLPKNGVVFWSVATTAGACAFDGVQTITCNIGALGAGGSVNVTVEVTAATKGKVKNKARIMGNEPDPDGSNNKAKVSVDIN